jgi:hypothetical protein
MLPIPSFTFFGVVVELVLTEVPRQTFIFMQTPSSSLSANLGGKLWKEVLGLSFYEQCLV